MNRDVEMAQHWIDRYAAGIDDDLQMDRVIEALRPTVDGAMLDRALIAAYGPDFDRNNDALRNVFTRALTAALKETP